MIFIANQNNFFRSVRNMVIDLTRMPAAASATGLHWQVSQATSLQNIIVHMSTASGNNHQGKFKSSYEIKLTDSYRYVYGEWKWRLHGRCVLYRLPEFPTHQPVM